MMRYNLDLRISIYFWKSCNCFRKFDSWLSLTLLHIFSFYVSRYKSVSMPFLNVSGS